MKVNEILIAISKFREDKLKSSQSTYRSRSPLYTPVTQTKSQTFNRSTTPISCLCESTLIIPKTRAQLQKFITSHKYHQLMEYKIDAASLMKDTLTKYKKRMFNLFEKCVSKFDCASLDVSFKGASVKSNYSPISEKNKAKYNLNLDKAGYYEEVYQSPSFTDHSSLKMQILHSEDWKKGLGVLFKCIGRLVLMIQWSVLSDVKTKVIRGITRVILGKVLETHKRKAFRDFINRVNSRQALNKKTWESPLKLDLNRLQVSNPKSDYIEFSSMDQSEVLFEPLLDTSSQFTTRFQNSVDRNIKDLTLSSIISNDDKIQTDRVLNFTKLRHTNKVVSAKPTLDSSDSLNFLRNSPVKKPIKLQVNNKQKLLTRYFNKGLGMISFLVESNLKQYAMIGLKKVWNDSLVAEKFSNLQGLANKRIKKLIGVIKAANRYPASFEKLNRIYKSRAFCSLAKRITIWKMVASVWRKRNESTNDVYTRSVFKSLRNIDCSLKNKQKSLVYIGFNSLKYKKHFDKLRTMGCKGIVFTLKRLSKASKQRFMNYCFSLLTILFKEFRIKYQAVLNITENVMKDINFRRSVCFLHWTSYINHTKSEHLKLIAFQQAISAIFNSKIRFAFVSLLNLSTSKALKSKQYQLLPFIASIYHSFVTIHMKKAFKHWSRPLMPTFSGYSRPPKVPNRVF